MTAKLVQGYEVVIGFETHAQLSTQSKIFSRAPTAFGAEPNTQACAVDMALPGTLPVMNVGAVERAIGHAQQVGRQRGILGNEPGQCIHRGFTCVDGLHQLWQQLGLDVGQGWPKGGEGAAPAST